MTTLAEILRMRPGQLENMSHSDLYAARMGAPAQSQATLAPYEHQAFAREWVGENPLNALSAAAAIPLYTAYKASGLSNARSPASFAEITQGYKGIGQGLSNWFTRTV